MPAGSQERVRRGFQPGSETEGLQVEVKDLAARLCLVRDAATYLLFLIVELPMFDQHDGVRRAGVARRPTRR